MSLTAFQNNVLNDQDLERGTLQKRPPLLFIPHVAEEAEGFVPPTTKIKISELVEEKVVLFTGTTPKAYVQLQDTFEGLLRKKGYRELYDKSEVMLKEAENRLDIHIKMKPDEADENKIASDSESEDEFEQNLAKARQVALAAARKKKAAGKQPAQQAKKGQKLTKLEKFQEKKIGYEMNIMAVQCTLAVQVQRAFELFEIILGEDASER